MKKLLNTLYVTIPNAYISKDGLNVVVSVNQIETFRIPIHNIESIVTFGYLGVSPGLMKLCADSNVSLVFLSPTGRFIGKFFGPTKGNVFLRKQQYSLSENPSNALNLGRNIIAAKIKNYRYILMRSLRDHGMNEKVKHATDELRICMTKIKLADNLDSIRGIEGDAAKVYFNVFNELILKNKSLFCFVGRNRRPPKDPVNAILSFIYTLLTNDMTAALESVGIDPYVGFLHTLRPGRPALSLDLIEELRAYLGDRLVLSLINLGQLGTTDFIYQEEGGVLLNEKGRKSVISAWQLRKKEEIVHPFLKEKISLGLLPYTQSLLLARYIRGDIDDYPVFILK